MDTWTFVFDLDGTLVDSAPDLAAATNHVMRELGLRQVDECDIRPFVGHGALVMVERTAQAQGRELDKRELDELFGVFIAHYTANISANSKPYDGVLAALQDFKDRGARLAVCTNKIETHARALLHDLGMTHYFSAITGRDSVGVSKPHPGHLTQTIALAGGSAARAVMIGDSETDIKTAQAARIPVVAVDFGYSVEPVAMFQPDMIISHYRDLAAALATLMSSRANT
jgi:phosphoglycolate phosphatase